MINKRTIFTFLDTSAIDPMYNSLNETYIELLEKHIDNETIILTTSPIVINEVYSHIKKELPKKYENLQGVLDSREFSLLKNNKKYNILSNSYDVSEMIQDCFTEFKKLLKKLKVKKIQDNRISLSTLMDMYFQSRPPFGGVNKKSEFPDAIIYLTLKKYLDDSTKIHVISNDNDWKSVQESDSGFIVHRSIKEYLDYLNQDNKLYALVRTYLNTKEARTKIINYFIEYANKLDFIVNGFDNSIHGMKTGFDYEYIEKLNIYDYDYIIDTFEDISLINDKYVAQVVIVCSAKVDVKCRYFDEEISIWDSESHEYIEREYSEIVETHELLIPIRILIECSNDVFHIFSYKIIECDYNILELNNCTRINRQPSQLFDKDKFRVLRHFECPHCRNTIYNLDLISDGTMCVSSNERSMGVENEYIVDVIEQCKNCGNTIHVTGSIWEYPAKTFNYENNITISKYEED